MKFKSAEEMKSKAYREKYKMTEKQKEWIDEFKKLIKDKLDEAYEKTYDLGVVFVAKSIERELVVGVDVEEFLTQLEIIKDLLIFLGYSVEEYHDYNKLSKIINEYALDIKWKLPQ